MVASLLRYRIGSLLAQPWARQRLRLWWLEEGLSSDFLLRMADQQPIGGQEAVEEILPYFCLALAQLKAVTVVGRKAVLARPELEGLILGSN